MRLIQLIVLKSTSEEIIRQIDFNEKGLSLIVDETNKAGSGSNIGKTTAVKIIDLCLGAKSVSSIYKEKDTGENTAVSEFIQKHKIVAELKCEIDGEIHIFKRALYKNGKNAIDGETVSNITEYRKVLNSLIFRNIKAKPTLRQLISKFIRLEAENETALLKFLGTYIKNYQYQAIYEYLFGIDEAKSQNIDIIALNENIDKDIEAIYRKNSVSSLKEFETKIDLMKAEVLKFKQVYSEVTVVEDYGVKIEENQKLLIKIQKYESLSSKLGLKIKLMEDKIEKEQEKIVSVDTKLLRRLYEETKLTLDQKLCDFEELENFHNGMVNKRIEMLRVSLNELEEESKELNRILVQQRQEYESNYVNLNVEIRDKFEEKYNDFSVNKIKLESSIEDYNYVLEKVQEKEANLGNKIDPNNDETKKEHIVETLNKYFKSLTASIIGDTYAIVLNDDEDEFPVKFIGVHGKPGTGIKKTMIACFDLAHINLIIEKGYHMPVFAVHDKMENIDLNELSGIISAARSFEGQYIFPILSDRVDTLGIKEEEVVLRLSAKDKFFHI